MSDDVCGGREPSWVGPKAAFDRLEFDDPAIEKAAHQRTKCGIIVALKVTNEPAGSNLQGIQIWRAQRVKKERGRLTCPVANAISFDDTGDKVTCHHQCERALNYLASNLGGG